MVVHLPAPRIWKVTHGASTLYIVGRIGLLPSGVQWNKAPIEKIMDHADRFIVPSYVTMSGIGELWGRYLPLGRELDDELSDIPARSWTHSSNVCTARPEASIGSRLRRRPMRF